MKQVKRFSLAKLLMAFALVATAAPAFALFGISSDLGQLRLLGMGIIALTLIIALLMVLFLPLNRNVGKHSGQFNRDEPYGDVAYRGEAPPPDADLAKAHDIPSDESEGL